MNLPVELQRIVAEYLTLEEKMYLERFRFIVKTKVTRFTLTFEDEEFLRRMHRYFMKFVFVEFELSRGIFAYNQVMDLMEYHRFVSDDFNRRNYWEYFVFIAGMKRYLEI